ncbi:DUF4190 domain-containing protein [Nocardioides jishulii]|uniref:DUF4190 domain-containing protein n=1 Tax=Nocardioides jishulii TaxID=2575440 RepID=A0A4U2YSM4_9ACTN|nr:DUF4190 domain-containing protein [Nocardioides jishulii]QCX28630.1 DUF4190 domain-containing protein [Nocardioides jishulii]TKI64477.1 DUF4190 domain-containing protein [Nocardioides jishulii]
MSDPNPPSNPYGQPSNDQPGYGQAPYGQLPGHDPFAVRGLGGPQPHPRGTTVLVLGIVGVFCCGFLAPVAWALGSSADNDVTTYPGSYSNAGQIKAGKILGMVGTAVLVLSFVATVLLIAYAGSMDLDQPSNQNEWSNLQ